jgi:hypothetical protein
VKKRRPKDKSNGRSKSSDAGVGFGSPNARSLISALSLLVIVFLAIVGLEYLTGYVYSLPECQSDIRIELINPPDWVDGEEWRPRILSVLELPSAGELTDGGLVRLIARQMSASGWVSQVNRVTQDMDGTIRVDCDYRRPIAMLYIDGLYIPVDKDGVRLPEVYDFVAEDSGWMRIFGVSGKSPEVGEPFVQEDALAAVRLASLVFDCGPEFSNRICGIDVNNFRGRRNKHENHILLRTRGGGLIEWGSAVGEELFEPTAAEKIRNIAVYFGTHSSQRHIDVSIDPDGFRWREPLDSGRVNGSRS